MVSHRITAEFYQREDVVQIAQDLLGKWLVTPTASGIITEVEAYCGASDRACHAYKRRTKRVEVMYRAGGRSYVYLCYGIHPLFNVVTNVEGKADACLIRSIHHVKGPGRVAKALGITMAHNDLDLTGNVIWIEDRNFFPKRIHSKKRIGVDYAGDDANLLWNFFIDDAMMK